MFLLGSNDALAYSEISFDYAKLAPLLWNNTRAKVLTLIAWLIRRQGNPDSCASAFVAAVACAVQPNELQCVSAEYSEVIPIFVKYQPTLAFNARTWELPMQIQWQINEILETLPLDQNAWSEIMAAKLIAATSVAVEATVKQAGSLAIHGALRRLDDPSVNGG